MGWTDDLLDTIGTRLARQIAVPASLPPRNARALAPYAEELQRGDVLLIDGGTTRIATAIKYLTQSTWSHAALCIGQDATGAPELVEAEIGHGIIRSPLRKYAGFHMRICRPVGLEGKALDELVGFVAARVGGQYDLRNVIDLARWLLPTPPVPQRFRRRMIALGSGEPTRAICASLIAEGFNRINYPILPSVEYLGGPQAAEAREVLHVRHHSLYTPRDFDVSPYFAVIKPTIARGFDYRRLEWAAGEAPPGTAVFDQA